MRYLFIVPVMLMLPLVTTAQNQDKEQLEVVCMNKALAFPFYAYSREKNISTNHENLHSLTN